MSCDFGLSIRLVFQVNHLFNLIIFEEMIHAFIAHRPTDFRASTKIPVPYPLIPCTAMNLGMCTSCLVLPYEPCSPIHWPAADTLCSSGLSPKATDSDDHGDDDAMPLPPPIMLKLKVSLPEAICPVVCRVFLIELPLQGFPQRPTQLVVAA